MLTGNSEPQEWEKTETVYVPRKILGRLSKYIQATGINQNERIFPISYVAGWSMVKKAGQIVGIELKPDDLRRHAATYASRSGTPIDIVSKVILRHADFTTTISFNYIQSKPYHHNLPNYSPVSPISQH